MKETANKSGCYIWKRTAGTLASRVLLCHQLLGKCRVENADTQWRANTCACELRRCHVQGVGTLHGTHHRVISRMAKSVEFHFCLIGRCHLEGCQANEAIIGESSWLWQAESHANVGFSPGRSSKLSQVWLGPFLDIPSESVPREGARSYNAAVWLSLLKRRIGWETKIQKLFHKIPFVFLPNLGEIFCPALASTDPLALSAGVRRDSLVKSPLLCLDTVFSFALCPH